MRFCTKNTRTPEFIRCSVFRDVLNGTEKGTVDQYRRGKIQEIVRNRIRLRGTILQPWLEVYTLGDTSPILRRSVLLRDRLLVMYTTRASGLCVNSGLHVGAPAALPRTLHGDVYVGEVPERWYEAVGASPKCDGKQLDNGYQTRACGHQRHTR